MEEKDQDRPEGPPYVLPITNVIVKASTGNPPGQFSREQSVLMMTGKPKSSIKPSAEPAVSNDPSSSSSAQATTSAIQQSSVKKSSANSKNPAAYSNNPAANSNNPAAYSNNPAANSNNPAVNSNNPAANTTIFTINPKISATSKSTTAITKSVLAKALFSEPDPTSSMSSNSDLKDLQDEPAYFHMTTAILKTTGPHKSKRKKICPHYRLTYTGEHWVPTLHSVGPFKKISSSKPINSSKGQYILHEVVPAYTPSTSVDDPEENPPIFNENSSSVASPGVIRFTKSNQVPSSYSAPSTSKIVPPEPIVCDKVVIEDSDDDSSENEKKSSSEQNFKTEEDKGPTDEMAAPTGAIPKRGNSRDARNKAEKLRRDRYNKSINELAALTPSVAESSRKIDKTGVLRLTASDLRKEHVFGNSIDKREFGNMPPQTSDTFAELLGGFLLTVTWKGIIVLVTSNVEKHLGHCRIDLLGQNILNYTHPDDTDVVRHELTPRKLPMGSNNQFIIPPEILISKDKMLRNEKRYFKIRLARATQRSETPQYVLCDIEGVLRVADKARGNTMNQVVRRNRSRGDEKITTNGNDIVFIGMVRIVKPQSITPKLEEASKMEYRTRHLIDGRIIQCDQRISIVAGYMTNEITGVSAFTFMHKDDVRWVIITLRQMYDRYKQIGESCYRLIARNGTFIYLKTRGVLEVNPTNNAVETFICINTLVSEEEGKALIKEMKQKYSVIIGAQAEQYTAISDEPGLEDPHQVEEAVMHLITNLPSPACTFPQSPSPGPITPPPQSLAIIPPKRATIKNAIAKSISVINQAIKLKPENSPMHQLTYDSNYLQEKFALKSSRPSVVCSNNSGELSIKVEHKSVNDQPSTSGVKVVPSMINIEPVLPIESKPSTSFEKITEAILPPTLDDPLLELPIISDNDLGILKNLTETNTNDYIMNERDDLLIENLDIDNILNQCPMDLFNDNSNDDNLLFPVAATTNIQELISKDKEAEQKNSFAQPTGPLKRARTNRDAADNGISKKKASASGFPNVDLLFCTEACTLDDLITAFTPKEDKTVSVNEIVSTPQPQPGFESYINELTDPDSDLDEVVPRSLAALDSTISQMTDDLTTENNQDPCYEQNLSDIIISNEEQKQILNSIQQDYEDSIFDNSNST